jgi:hypothetical protein
MENERRTSEGWNEKERLVADDDVVEEEECADEEEDDDYEREDENCSGWLLLGVGLLNAAALLGMLAAREWAGSSHSATSFNYATPLSVAPWVGSLMWNVITYALLVSLVWPFLPWLSPERKRDAFRLSQPFILACASHAMWSMLWSYGMLTLSAVVSLAICAQLMVAGIVLAKSPLLCRLPFSLWFGWAVIGSVSQASVALYYELRIELFGSVGWSVAAMILVLAMAYTWGSLAEDPFFSTAVAIAFFGVAQQQSQTVIITRVAYTCCIAAAAHALICLILACDAVQRQQARDALAQADDEYDCEEAATTDDQDEGKVATAPQLPYAPLLSLPIEDSQPLYPTRYATVQPPMAAAAAGVSEDYNAAQHYLSYYYPSYSAAYPYALHQQQMAADQPVNTQATPAEFNPSFPAVQ